MSVDFVWPSDRARAENDELDRVCEYLEEVLDEKERNENVPTLEWGVQRCQALQHQGFDRIRLDVLEKTFTNAIEAHRSLRARENGGQ